MDNIFLIQPQQSLCTAPDGKCSTVQEYHVILLQFWAVTYTYVHT